MSHALPSAHSTVAMAILTTVMAVVSLAVVMTRTVK